MTTFNEIIGELPKGSPIVMVYQNTDTGKLHFATNVDRDEMSLNMLESIAYMIRIQLDMPINEVKQ